MFAGLAKDPKRCEGEDDDGTRAHSLAMGKIAMTTILLVEDEAKLAQVVIQEVEKHGYQVLRAGDGLTALHLCEQH